MTEKDAAKREIGRRVRIVRMAIMGTGEGAQAAMNTMLGLSRGLWGQYERGIAKPPFEVLTKIRDRYGIAPDYIIAGDLTHTDPPYNRLILDLERSTNNGTERPKQPQGAAA